MCSFISQYSTSTLQNNFIRIIFVGRLSGGWQYSHANKSNTVTAKEDVKSFLLQCNLSTDLLVFIKLKFLRILNSSQSFQEQVMTCSSCNYNIWERKKTGYSCAWIYFNIYFCITYLIWFMTSYTMRRTFLSIKVRRRPNLRVVRTFSLTFCKEHGLRVPVELHRYFGFLYWRSIYWNKWGIF